MRIITIGGIPGTGKTTLGKELGQKYKALSLELESLRWKFFKENIQKNLLYYTKNKSFLKNESLREYYLRATIYEKVVNQKTFIKWNINTMKYINNIVNNLISELREIEKNRDLEKLKLFIKNNRMLINYVPKVIDLSILDYVILTHPFISRLDIVKEASENKLLNIDINTCKERFKAREKIDIDKYDDKINNYLESCLKCIIDLNKKDIRIKNDDYNFHFRVVAVIMKDNKFLIQQIDGYNYYILPGGHVKLGEDSIEAVEREVKEEIGCDIYKEKTKLFCLHENFYYKKGKKEHWLENYFIVTPQTKLPKLDWKVKDKDGNKVKVLKFKWVTLAEIKDIDLRPKIIKDILINRKYNDFNYLINKE